MVVRGEVRLDVPDVLGRAPFEERLGHLLVVFRPAQTAAHRHPQVEELVEALEGVQRPQLGEGAHRQGHVVARGHLPQRLGRDRALEVDVQLRLGHAREDVGHR